MLEMVDHMANLDSLQFVWSSLGTILKSDHQMLIYIKRACQEKAADIESLQGTLPKEEFISAGFKAALALEEERKNKAKNKVTKLEARMAKLVLEAMTQAMEEFKACFEIRNLNVEFGQEALPSMLTRCLRGFLEILNKRPKEGSPSTEEEVKEDRGRSSSFVEEYFGGNQRGHSSSKLAYEGLCQFQHSKGNLQEGAG
ncbi:hypothetical protein COCNU_scaffold003178G000010 [Cocos nucifera]|nr:hypothetical protein [Cocos nucifera]